MKRKSLTKKQVANITAIVFGFVLLVMGSYYLITTNKDNETVEADSDAIIGDDHRVDDTRDDSDKVTIPVSQLGHINTERKRLKVTFGPSYYIPTGLYVKEKQKITVTLNEHDQILHPRLIISTPVLSSHTDAEEDGTVLKPGTKEITAPKDGIIYIVNNNYETDTPPEVTIEGANILPTFKRGETTFEEWNDMLVEHDDAPAFELRSEKAVITAGMDHINLVSDPEQLLMKHDEAIDIQAKASGLYEDDPDPLHQPTPFRYHFRHGEGDFWMYAFFNHTGYHTDALKDLLNVETFTKNGWGPWHELGHVHQQGATTPGIFGEVTNNVFSMIVQREFDQPSRLENDNRYASAFSYLEGEANDFYSLDDFETLVPLWQIDLAYGEEWYPAIYRMVRETDEEDLPNSDEEKIQNFIYLTSKATEQNLIPFYERWGLVIDDNTSDKILALNLPELTAPIWWNRDTNNTIKPHNVTISSLTETLEAYKEELPEELFITLNDHLTKAKEDDLGELREEITDLLNSQRDEELISEKMYEIFLSQVELVDL